MKRVVVLLVAAASCMMALAGAMDTSSREREKSWWLPRHEDTVKKIAEGPKEYDLVFVGDSITDFWSNRRTGGGKVLEERFGKYKVLNLGVMGDRIENMMWRLENGEVDGWTAKVIMVLAGTNNIGKRGGGEDIAMGTERLIRYLRQKHPEARIVHIPILPRNDGKRGKNAEDRIAYANALTEKLADGDAVTRVDFSAKLLNDDGSMKKELFRDGLHPRHDGYVIWADAVAPVFERLMALDTPPPPLSEKPVLIKEKAVSTADEIAKYESGGQLAVDPSETVVDPPKDMKLILCIGQSNMAGRAGMTDDDKAVVPNAYKLNRDDKWVAAKSPYHFDRKYAAVGPVDDFVKLYLKDHPGESVGVVPCAVGGTSVTTWVAEGRRGPGGNFKRALERAKIAAENGKFIAILWHQGETDAAKYNLNALMKTYPGRVKGIAEALRRELGDDNIPFIVGEIGRWQRRDGDHAARINPCIDKVAEMLPHCGVASSEGLTNQDAHHFNRESQRTLAQRYYEAFQKARGEE